MLTFTMRSSYTKTTVSLEIRKKNKDSQEIGIESVPAICPHSSTSLGTFHCFSVFLNKTAVVLFISLIIYMFRSTPMSRLLEKDWKDIDQTTNKITSGETSRKGRRQVNKGENITSDACILCFSFLKATVIHLILLKVYHKSKVHGSSVQSRWKDRWWFVMSSI